MNPTPQFEHESFARRHRGGMLLERHGIDLYPHPFLGFTLAPGLRSDLLNTDDAGFRLSDSPYGTVDSASWLAAGGGGILLGNSVALALAASSDRTTVASYLAGLTGVRQLNLGLCAAVSLQELVAAVPFLELASTVVIVGGGPDFVNLVGSLTPGTQYGTVSYERTFDDLTRVPLFDVAALAAGKTVPDLDAVRRRHVTTPDWDLAQVHNRMEVAAARRLRDLRVLARAVPTDARVLFCLQPLASTRTRDITAAERARYDFDAPVFGILHSAVEENWKAYADVLAAGCAELGVSFLNLAADRFVGDSFADTVHLTDAGNRQAAELIQAALGGVEGSAAVPPLRAADATPAVASAPAADATPAGTGEDRTAQLAAVVTEILELPPGQLTSDGDFINDYGADSMLVIDILARIEVDMGVRIPDTDIPKMTSLAAVVALVEENAGEPEAVG
ncbi:acyl carrier protein [Micromonospora sp. WMMA1363]|uniref:acyl carrier protein n=1 Tax=Micromonospora sp. WMMA1363 TaxID=3053985 RepID=UPI00259CADD8|nr:acyl carrier protein [Micromonospora sp. WMMA1363]MDM4718152.1 acyl carrier protein [Micromonospora sp. WMMA1363]